MEDNMRNNGAQKKRFIRKAGRTLLVTFPNLNNSTVNYENLFNSTTYEGLQNTSTKNNNLFLTFDNITNSVKAYKKLRQEHSEWRVKFSYYRVFFTMVGLSNNNDYNTVKQSLVTFVSDKTNTNVLYCKFYRKDNNLLGCGDLTVDTIDGMNMLLNKEDGLKEFSFDSFSGTFYRFNDKQENRQQTS